MPSQPLVWITGASSGIGRALAVELAGRGRRLVLTARRMEKLEEVRDAILARHPGTEIHLAEGDVTDAPRMAAIVEMMDGAGGIDIAVLNAGIYEPMDATNPDLDNLHRTFATNLGGVANCVVPLIHAMKARRRGHIAIVASVAGYSGLPMAAAYGATKAGLINMAESLRFDAVRMGIKMQVINPGFVDTPATDDNPFVMPFIIQPEDAARRMADGLESDRFEITFPRRFTYQLKLLRIMPYPLYNAIIARVTGWKDKPLGESPRQ